MSMRCQSGVEKPRRRRRLERRCNQHLLQIAALGDMDTASTLVRIYLFICRRYRGRLQAMAQRQSNNADPAFTDEEVLKTATASYVFGLIRKRSSISKIHEYIRDHFSEWFPDLPSYQSYNRRLNRLSAVFAPLVEEALSEVRCTQTRKEAIRIADSMPIMLAKGQRASQAKVASERFASVGYCSSKDTFFHGVKLHLVVERRSENLPVPKRAGLTPGSENDLRDWIVSNPSARVADNRGRRPLRRQGLLRRAAERTACSGPRPRPTDSDQEEQRTGDPLSSRQALFRGRRPHAPADRVPFQLDR